MKSIVLATCLIATAACTEVTTEPFAPEETASVAVSELGNACTLQCRNAWLQCNATCDRFPRPGCEENCDARLVNCMRVCGCPFVEEFDRVVADHVEATSTFLCVGDFPNPGLVHQVFNLFKRTERVRRTLQCDGAISETVLSAVVSSDGQCASRLFPPVGCPVGGGLVIPFCGF